MPDRSDRILQEKLSQRLKFYEDMGLAPFYRDRATGSQRFSTVLTEALETRSVTIEESALPKRSPKITTASDSVPRLEVIASTSDETLLKIQQDLGECTRCKLHKTRNKIVFGDGNPKADLVFIGEGPGADEDEQGLPFVGRAGKLLTQMIEAMGLQRRDVYICNVVKCRPPGNRQPESDEVEKCAPFLFRQLDSIRPKVIVCLGATAAQTLLQTNRSISHFRGQWVDFRGYKMLATYHPAYLLRNPGAKGEVWKDLQKVMAELGLEVKKTKAK